MVSGRSFPEQTGLPMLPAFALSDEQRTLVVAAAHAVPMRWRARFMAAVAHLLTMNPAPTNKDVISSCAAAKRAISVGISTPSLD
jgi:hypothetical protein